MTEHPDTITVAKCHPFRGDNFYITLPESDRSGVEYIRADVSATHIADLTAKLAEREAQVARLLEMQTDREVDHERQLADAREVKPLEWHQISSEPDRWMGHQADVSNPDYFISLTADSPDVFAWGLNGEGWSGFCDTLEAAKVAAQADYTARILSALKGTP